MQALRPPRASVASQHLQARQQRHVAREETQAGAAAQSLQRQALAYSCARCPASPQCACCAGRGAPWGTGAGEESARKHPRKPTCVCGVFVGVGVFRTFFDFLDAWAPAPCLFRQALGCHYTAMALGRHLRSFLSARAAVSCVFLRVSFRLTGAPWGGPPSTWHPCSRHAPLKGTPWSLEHEHTPLPSP